MFLYGRPLSIGGYLAEVLADFPAQLAQVEGLFRRAFDGETVRGTVVLEGQSGRRRAYDINLFPLRDGAGTAIGAVVQAERAEADLQAALAETQAQLRMSEAKAERTALAKSHFFAALSHDLRQPAQALTLLSYLLRERAAGTPAADLVAPIDEAVTALRLVLEGVLDLSRLDAGTVEVQDEPLMIGGMLARLAAEFGPRAERKGLAFHCVASTAMVTTDSGLLEHILRQLVENALRFTMHGKIVLGCRHHGSQLAVEVLDTGLGIPDDEREAIFEDFYQIGNEARDRSLGLGVGLAVARRLARLIGARISVTSVPGQGSRFVVEVDKARTAPPGLGEAQSSYAAVRRAVAPVVAGALGRARRSELGRPGLPVPYKPAAADDLSHAVARLALVS